MGRYVEVVGRGAAAQPPDRLDLHVGVSVVAADVGAALARVGTQVARLGHAVRALGLEDRDIRSTHSSVGEEYLGPNAVREGFRADQGLVLRIRDLDAVATVLDAAVTAVGDDFRLQHLAWAVSDEAALADLARTAAFEDARAKASRLADLAGRSLGELQRVTEGESFQGGPFREVALAKASPGFAPERGESQVEVSLTTRWALD